MPGTATTVLACHGSRRVLEYAIADAAQERRSFQIVCRKRIVLWRMMRLLACDVFQIL